jgi:acyl-coenzyme A synthetase/AMP-(fatty) acid ligase
VAYVVGNDSLQIAYSAGAPLLNRVRTEFGRMFGCRVLDCYGITEAPSNLCATLQVGDPPELSCGVPYPPAATRSARPAWPRWWR